MKYRIEQVMAILLIICVFTSLFYGCEDEKEITRNDAIYKNNGYEHPEMSMEEITLRYRCWQDIEISEALAKEFEALYPNIDVVVEQYEVSSSGNSNSPMEEMAASKPLPDCFWILGSPKEFIENGLLYDMSEFWENDPDADNVIKGINEYKLGYFGTEQKWATPVKFFPTAAFINLDVFIRNNMDMPDMDWTWDEFEETVEKMTMNDKESNKYIFGLTDYNLVISWYPLASDKECIGEFGWNGIQFDMENWTYGMNLKAKWIQNENCPYALDEGGVEQLSEKYGEGVLYPQDIGYSAIHLNHWWTWEDYWITETWIEKNKVIFVPYMMPQEEDAKGGTYLSTMDMGGIYSETKYPYEAYELLKFMTWGPEGWKYKLKHYPNLLEESTGKDRAVSKNHCPITLDSEVWEGFIKWHPNSETGDAIVTDLYGEEYSRAKYFDYFMKKVQESIWTCYGGQQIPGFDTWYQNIYSGKDGLQDYGYENLSGIEAACIHNGVDAKTHYEYLQEQANKISKEGLKELEGAIKAFDKK